MRGTFLKRTAGALAVCGAAIGAFLATSAAPVQTATQPPEPTLIVHEWGTFTSLQDESGNELSHVNTDDEPVPKFVHRIQGPRLLQPGKLSIFGKGLRFPKGRNPGEQITMRMETPVMYFHRPESAKAPLTLDVEVRYRGGWLSEYYPHAIGTAPGIEDVTLTPETVGKLVWKDVTLGGQGQLPETEEAVWLTPRNVDAETVTVGEEAEKYLFYRGVAADKAPLRVVTDRAKDQLSIHGRMGDAVGCKESARIPALWLVQVQADDTMAFRHIEGFTFFGADDSVQATTRASFDKDAFSEDNFQKLHEEMHAALVADGLFDDEATAMLETWKHAYFKTVGLRLFFIVPKRWTDHRLPLQLSVPARIERTMVGRIELISASQRKALAALEHPARKKTTVTVEDEDGTKHEEERMVLDWAQIRRDYLSLGRFRNALIFSRLEQGSTPQLKQIARMYGLLRKTAPTPGALTLPTAANSGSALPPADSDGKARGSAENR